MHTIIGGSNFDKTLDYAGTQKGKCTTAPISIDKSAYWTRKFPKSAQINDQLFNNLHSFEKQLNYTVMSEGNSP
jgi:hypothetical protein